MKEEIVVHGIVLSSAAAGDYDKRLTVLSQEHGKMTVWAAGARRPNSKLMAGSRNFVFGEFVVYPTRSGYGLKEIRIESYFEEIASDLVCACYGSYFLELVSYFAQEDMDATEYLNLLYLSLKALLAQRIPNELVRRIFELRCMKINGEYTEYPPKDSSEGAAYAWNFVIQTPLEKLYTFTLSPNVLEEFSELVEYLRRRFVRGSFRSLDILKTL